MEFWSPKTIKTLLVPGGFILLGAWLVLETGWFTFSPSGVTFFYYAVAIAAALLAWRFHSRRILFSLIVLALAHHAIYYFAKGAVPLSGSGRVAFEAVGILLPVDFAFLAFFSERGDEGRALLWFIGLLFFESVFVAVAARPEQPAPAFLHFPFFRSYHAPLPQPALLALGAAVVLLLVRFFQFHKAIDSGMLWSLAATWLGLQSGAITKAGTAYFGAAALCLASSIIENSYSLAYQDELTGLHSRRSFNDALFRLKRPYAIAVVDIDHFKSINDTYGHDTGDQVLRLVASKLSRVGGGGEAFRVGGEEFTILFPGKTLVVAEEYLELLRLNIENSTFRVRSGEERRKVERTTERRTLPKRQRPTPRSGVTSLSVTVSIGLAQSSPKSSVQEVIQQADKALYRAKQGGRNRTEIAAPAVQRKAKKSATRV